MVKTWPSRPYILQVYILLIRLTHNFFNWLLNHSKTGRHLIQIWRFIFPFDSTWAMLLILTSLISWLHPRIRPKNGNLFIILFVKLSLNVTFETFWPHYVRVSGRGLPVRKKRKSLQVNKTAIPSIRIPKLTNLPTMTSWCWFDQPMARFC